MITKTRLLVTFIEIRSSIEHNSLFYNIFFIFCVKACASGMYGQNCSVPCENCLKLEQCHHINGTCMNGCASGYKGSRCTEGENMNFDTVRYIIHSWLTTSYSN